MEVRLVRATLLMILIIVSAASLADESSVASGEEAGPRPVFHCGRNFISLWLTGYIAGEKWIALRPVTYVAFRKRDIKTVTRLENEETRIAFDDGTTWDTSIGNVAILQCLDRDRQ